MDALKEPLRGHMENLSVIRKSTQDFGDFGGVTLTTVGLFEDVCVTYLKSGSIDEVDIGTRFNQWRTTAEVEITLTGRAGARGLRMRAKLIGPDGVVAAETECGLEMEEGRYPDASKP